MTFHLGSLSTALPRPQPAHEARRAVFAELPATPEAARLARRLTRRTLATWQLAHLQEAAELIVSEIATNAVRHGSAGGAAIGLRLETGDNCLRIEVHDTDRRPPRPRVPAALGESGFGFVIIEALADKWGTRDTAGGKAVWVSLAVG